MRYRIHNICQENIRGNARIQNSHSIYIHLGNFNLPLDLAGTTQGTQLGTIRSCRRHLREVQTVRHYISLRNFNNTDKYNFPSGTLHTNTNTVRKLKERTCIITKCITKLTKTIYYMYYIQNVYKLAAGASVHTEILKLKSRLKSPRFIGKIFENM